MNELSNERSEVDPEGRPTGRRSSEQSEVDPEGGTPVPEQAGLRSGTPYVFIESRSDRFMCFMYKTHEEVQ